MKNIVKTFPGVRALQGVDFTLCKGEIHALMGENGAGKSTLIKVLTGVYEKDGGEIFLEGLDKAAVIKSPQDAQNLGISTVYQEITLCPNLTVAENIKEIKEVSRSYKEAKMALDVGKIFFAERDIIAYSELGIGRLIYQLPIPLCKMFIKEIFGGKSPDDFDEETLTTINKFFENSLNVSETSRQLFIHRNTLVYRLDKLQKSTGLDLRVFEDAITFKIALMVVRYMKYMESFEY